MSTTVKQLERHALDARRRGIGWSVFWKMHGRGVCAAEPWNRTKFRRLVNRLLALVASGDCDGQEPAGDVMPWEIDDEAAKPPDVGTQARCLIPLRPAQEATR